KSNHSFKLLTNISHECHRRDIAFFAGHVFYLSYFCDEVRFALLKVRDASFEKALNQNFDSSIRKFPHPHDHGNCSKIVDLRRRWHHRCEVCLACEQNDSLSFTECVDNRLDRRISSYEQGKNHERIRDKIADRKERETFFELYVI